MVLIESGPGSTLAALEAGLAKEGLSSRDVTHVLLTHIHLDHAGAAGWLARQGAQVYVHPVGAPHMLNPEKLIASATRIYGERMETLWGEFLPVPQSPAHSPRTTRKRSSSGICRFLPINTPGHAEHHYSYLFEDVCCYCGDVGGVRIPGYPYLRVPMAAARTAHRALACDALPACAGEVRAHRADPLRHLRRSSMAVGRGGKRTGFRLPLAGGDDARRPAHRGIARTFHRLDGGGGGEDRAGRGRWRKPTSWRTRVGMSADGLQRYWRKVRMAA
ncbi:MAG: MBL fold metallo-hydrolase [Candidatus Moduliflexus flocculans]|nr:MBL fold metallo-hydrolase [Candidatus Moduliflexus flocculans]